MDDMTRHSDRLPDCDCHECAIYERNRLRAELSAERTCKESLLVALKNLRAFYPPACGADTLIAAVIEAATKRELFAAMAMQGYLASVGVVGGPVPRDEDIARYSVDTADALLAALEETK